MVHCWCSVLRVLCANTLQTGFHILLFSAPPPPLNLPIFFWNSMEVFKDAYDMSWNFPWPARSICFQLSLRSFISHLSGWSPFGCPLSFKRIEMTMLEMKILCLFINFCFAFLIKFIQTSCITRSCTENILVNCCKCSEIVVLMPVKFVLWLISAVLLVLHGKMDTNANEDAFGDYNYGLVQNSCALQFVRRRLPLCGVAWFESCTGQG